MNTKTRSIVLMGLFTAIVAVATMFIKIPTIGTQGYINIGDSMIFVASVLFGPGVGMVAGGVGSALGDILGGYAHYAPITLIVKGLEGLVVGYFGHKTFSATKKLNASSIFAMILGGAIMVLGYFLAEGIFLYGFGAALAGVIGNLGQGVGSVLIATPILLALSKINFKF